MSGDVRDLEIGLSSDPSPGPAPRSLPATALSRTPPTSVRENLRIVFPLFFVGAASFVLSLFLFQSAGTLHPSRIPLWLLSLSIGVVATAGASTAVFFGDFSEVPEGLGESALRSREFLLVPRTEWERMRAAFPPGLGSPIPASALGHDDALRGTGEGNAPPRGSEASPSIPLWEESIFTPDEVYRAGRSSRATDHLAEQVDELIRELDFVEEARGNEPRGQPEPRRPGSGRKGAETSSAGGEGSVGAGAPEQSRGEYEALLRQLKTEAEQSVDPARSRRDLVCSNCERAMGVDEPWEACRGCWRTFCPDCLRKIHPKGHAFSCPKCGRRE